MKDESAESLYIPGVTIIHSPPLLRHSLPWRGTRLERHHDEREHEHERLAGPREGDASRHGPETVRKRDEGGWRGIGRSAHSTTHSVTVRSNTQRNFKIDRTRGSFRVSLEGCFPKALSSF